MLKVLVENHQTSIVSEVELGVKGPRGFSNYEIAVRCGFEGTEQEWLDSLKPENNLSKKPGNAIVVEEDGLYVPDDVDGSLLEIYTQAKES